MTKRMLVDATHGEETRVAVVNGNRLEELDFEIASRKQLKGNIYLAKVIRVEPSLQAAFVEYGGNRHGFLAFSEIHPDYYRIPMEDRAALMAEEERLAAEARRLEAEAEAAEDAAEAAAPAAEAERIATDAVREPAAVDEFGLLDLVDAPAGDVDGETGEGFDETVAAPLNGDVASPDLAAADQDDGDDDEDDGESESARHRRPRSLRSYKIQEVIKRRQVLLVQVTKEERGNKGAALTTYLSLPGRYCVLMPNTGRGGGISRKITNPADRRRLKDIMSDLDIPDGMAVILRTAGLERAKPEIKRDLEYLLRLWDDIREQTLKSVAPTLIYEEANLIKRAIRDVYADDIEEVLVDGEAGFRTAQNFMRMMSPSHVGRVQPYRENAAPLFHRYQVEQQIDAIHSPVVQLRSGGYIVINPTEALVAIDVNSGRSTRERNIEETAFKTNLEAAEEVARQLRLRDLAGLIVIDFIDMEDSRNNMAVERRLKEAMKNDRSRIQVGRISTFGLLELSRQRLRPSLQETNFERCPHCEGTGVVRSVESAALHVLRAIADEGVRRRAAEILVYAPTRVVLYLLNNKRPDLSRLETRYGMRVSIANDDGLIGSDTMRIERMRARTAEDDNAALVSAERILEETDRELAATEEPFEDAASDDAAAEDAVENAAENGDAGADGGRRRRRRRRRGGRDFNGGREIENESEEESRAAAEPGAEDVDGETGVDAGAEADGGDAADDEPGAAEDRNGDERGDRRGRRRRGRRGGRRDRNEDGAATEQPAEEAAPPRIVAVLPPTASVAALEPIDFDLILDGEAPVAPAPAIVATQPAATTAAAVAAVEPAQTEPAQTEPAEAVAAEAPKPARKRKTKAETAGAETTADAESAATEAEAPAKPARKRKTKAETAAEAENAPAEAEATAEEAAAKPARKRKTKAETTAAETTADAEGAATAAEAPAKPVRKRKTKAETAAEAVPAEDVASDDAASADVAPATAEAVETAPVETANVGAAGVEGAEPANAAAEVVNQEPEAPRRGWWRR